jgi:uncharacterized protein YndB with AHSA1/START domain
VGDVSVTVVIDAPPSKVWEAIEPIERHVEWMADALAIRFTGEQHRGVGTQFVCDTKIGPIHLADDMEITEWVPGEVMGVRHSGIVQGVGRFTLDPLDGGSRTSFTWAERLRFPWYLGATVGSAAASRAVLTPLWRRNLLRLKAIVESPRTA